VIQRLRTGSKKNGERVQWRLANVSLAMSTLTRGFRESWQIVFSKSKEYEMEKGKHKECYGTMFPDALNYRDDEPNSGKVFTFELKTAGGL
jgi:hypothetical protein